MASFRPLVTVFNAEADAKAVQVPIPAVLVAPIRPDIVKSVFTKMNKNNRQAYAVSPGAGHQHSAHSWGTGRAVSRIPRVSGGGTSRAGQAAFGNMCRKGRMFAPTKVWRKWHVKTNLNQRRYAVVSALAASAVPALVMARGHAIADVAEVPCVVNSSIESIKKTKAAVAFLKSIGAYGDVEKVQKSKTMRCGKGKRRNGRRFTQRTGPLVIYANDDGVSTAFRGISGVETQNVERLNLLQLAPGGHMGRFVIWSEAAFTKLNEIYGTTSRVSTMKSGYTLPNAMVTNSDITRIINSDEIQAVVRPQTKNVRLHTKIKKNPLKNLQVMTRMNPYSIAVKRAEILAQQKNVAEKAALIANGRAKQTAKQIKKAKMYKANKKINGKRLLA